MPKLTPDAADIKHVVDRLRNTIRMLPYCLSLAFGTLLAFFGFVIFLPAFSTGLPFLGGIIGFFAGITIGGLLSSPVGAMIAWMIHVLFLLKRLNSAKSEGMNDQNE
jgi:TRAP-type C4-dicarboxylate transport system permease small subunit